MKILLLLLTCLSLTSCAVLDGLSLGYTRTIGGVETTIGLSEGTVGITAKLPPRSYGKEPVTAQR